MRRFLFGLAITIVIIGKLAEAGWVRYERMRDPDRLLRAGRAALAAKQWDAADVYANRLIAYGHRDHGRLLRGESLYRQKKAGSAVEALNRVTSDGPLRTDAFVIQGLCLLELGNQREAGRVFHSVLADRPDDIEAHRGLAVIAYDQGLWTEAERFLQKVADLDPADGRAYRMMGNIDLDLNLFDSAETRLRLALDRALPGDMPGLARVDLAVALAGQKKYTDALEELAHANLDDAPRNVRRLRVDCLRSLGRLDEALRQVDADLADRLDDTGLMAEKGLVLLDRRRTADAAEWLEKSLAKDAHDVMARNALMRAYHQLGRKAAALEQEQKIAETEKSLRKLTELTYEAMNKPWDAAVRHQLADTCTKLNKPELARMWALAALACERR